MYQSASCSGVRSNPLRWWAMSWFWQKTQRRLQPEKNTEPEPLCPWMQGSSYQTVSCNGTIELRPRICHTLSKVRCDNVDHHISADQTCACPFKSIHTTKPRAKIAI